MQTRIQVYIVDDHSLIVEGLKASLLNTDDIIVVGQALNGGDCLHFLQTHTPDIIILDLNLPDINGIDLCAEILKMQPGIKVLGLSTSNHPVQINRLLNNGAKGYLLKNTDISEILEAIRHVYRGHVFICREAGNVLFKTNTNLPGITLTKRESEVLQWLAEGMTAPEIAKKLHLSQLTVESHRRNIMAKLKAKNTAMLIKIAIENNLI